MKAILLRTELGDTEVVNIDGLDDMQKYIEGYIEHVYSNEKYAVRVYVNEDGRAKFADVNTNLVAVLKGLSGHDRVANLYGPALVTAYDESLDISEDAISHIGSVIDNA